VRTRTHTLMIITTIATISTMCLTVRNYVNGEQSVTCFKFISN